MICLVYNITRPKTAVESAGLLNTHYTLSANDFLYIKLLSQSVLCCILCRERLGKEYPPKVVTYITSMLIICLQSKLFKLLKSLRFKRTDSKRTQTDSIIPFYPMSIRYNYQLNILIPVMIYIQIIK